MLEDKSFIVLDETGNEKEFVFTKDFAIEKFYKQNFEKYDIYH